MQVHVSLSHGEEFSRVHSPSAVWVQSVSARGFEVCARAADIGSNGSGIINWLAFQRQPQIGRKRFQNVGASGKHCFAFFVNYDAFDRLQM